MKRFKWMLVWNCMSKHDRCTCTAESTYISRAFEITASFCLRSRFSESVFLCCVLCTAVCLSWHSQIFFRQMSLNVPLVISFPSYLKSKFKRNDAFIKKGMPCIKQEWIILNIKDFGHYRIRNVLSTRS